jgi:hypothetical protein
MRRSFILLAVICALLWQSVALARVGSTVNALADLEHAALHWQQVSHSHHDDGSYHLDESCESVQHVLMDPAGASAALLTFFSQDFRGHGSTSPGGEPEHHPPDPVLEGLLRPPRLGF